MCWIAWQVVGTAPKKESLHEVNDVDIVYYCCDSDDSDYFDNADPKNKQ